MDASTYNSFLNLSASLDGSNSGAGSKYYYTDVVSTFDFPKRVVVYGKDEDQEAVAITAKTTDCGAVETAEKFRTAVRIFWI